MNYVGVDLHKEQSWFYVMDENGKRLDSRSISNCKELLKKYFETIPKPFKFAVESTFNWYFMVDLAEEFAEEVYLANSYETKAFAKRNKKTDKIDARLIAELLRKGYLPTVTIPGKGIREVKEMLRFRMNIVRDRTMNVSRLRCLLNKLGKNPQGDYTAKKNLEAINLTEYPEIYSEVLSGYTERIQELTEKLKRTEKAVKELALKDDDIMRLISIPGINYFSAALIKSEIIDINRFKTFNRLCAYAGLAPRVHQSGNTLIHGPLNKNRRKNLQWILIEVVFHFMKAIKAESNKHAELAKRKGYNTAKISICRDMLKVIYHVLKEKREFYVKKPKFSYETSGMAPALTSV